MSKCCCTKMVADVVMGTLMFIGTKGPLCRNLLSDDHWEAMIETGLDGGLIISDKRHLLRRRLSKCALQIETQSGEIWSS
jgi:hypothetical protein